jgi:hypothetical protein
VRTLTGLVIAAVIIRVCWGAWPTQTLAGLIIGLPLYTALYLWSLHRRPWRPCPRCQGGRLRDRRGLWTRYHSHCRRCGNSGELPRLGTRLLGRYHDTEG